MDRRDRRPGDLVEPEGVNATSDGSERSPTSRPRSRRAAGAAEAPTGAAEAPTGPRPPGPGADRTLSPRNAGAMLTSGDMPDDVPPHPGQEVSIDDR